MITDWLPNWVPGTDSDVPDPNNLGKVANSYHKLEEYGDDFIKDRTAFGTVSGFGAGILPSVAVAGTTAFNPVLGAAAAVGLSAGGAATGAAYGKINESRAEKAEDYSVITETDAEQIIEDAEELSYFNESMIPGTGGYETVADEEIDEIYQEINSQDSDTFLRWFEDKGNDGDDWFELTVYGEGSQEVYGGSVGDAEDYASAPLADGDVIENLLN